LGCVCALIGVASLSTLIARAEVESVELYLYGAITQTSKRQIVRVLSPYVEKDSISFRQMLRADGSEHPWVTIVEVRPRGWYVDFYDLVHRIKDTRGVRDGRVLWRTDVTATCDLRAHFGYTRRSFGWIPGWVQARGLVTSGLWHHLRARGSGEDLVFHPNEQYDQLRLAPHRGQDVRIRGRIGGFDGPYPVVVLGDFEIMDGERDEAAASEPIPRRIHPDLPPDRPKRDNRDE
jgi:hypothetical protein